MPAGLLRHRCRSRPAPEFPAVPSGYFTDSGSSFRPVGPIWISVSI